MYRMDPAEYRRSLEMLVELLNMGAFLRTPVRQLSLGQLGAATFAFRYLEPLPLRIVFDDLQGRTRWASSSGRCGRS
jgi:ABC-2 type transport system ATP-binding protein